MNNQDEEKAREIADKLVDDVKDGLCDGVIRQSALYGALEMAKWKNQQMIEWLDKNAWKYAKDHQEVNTDKMIEDFKQAMEEE